MIPTLSATWPITLMAVVFVLVCVFLILVILIQKPKGGGLSGAFGGSGGSAQAAFGAKTGDVLTWFTVVCFVLFLLLAMSLTWAIQPEHVRQQQQAQPASALEEAVRQVTTESTVVPGADQPTAADPGEGAAASVEGVGADDAGEDQPEPAQDQSQDQDQDQETTTPQP